jgi:RimK family alpha-L-glutamate ligase
MARPLLASSTDRYDLGVLVNPDSWYWRDLQRAARHLGFRMRPLSFAQLSGRLLTPMTRVAVWTDSPPIAGDGAGDGARIELTADRLPALLVRGMPRGTLEQIIFRMNILQRLSESGVRVVNPPRSLEIAIDKWLTLDRLQAAGLPVPQTICCQGRDAALEAFERLGGDVVIKPLFGGEGRGIMRVDQPDLAWRVFTTLEQLGSVIYVQEFLEGPGYDIRVLVIGERAVAVRRTARGDWRNNLSRGATAEPIALDGDLERDARTACRSLGLEIAGVDFIPTRGGDLRLLEVNAVPGWKKTAAACPFDIPVEMLQHIIPR